MVQRINSYSIDVAKQRDLLTEAERDRIYVREIRPTFLEAVDRSPAPTAIIVGGQPGSGKTAVMREVNTRLETAAVLISGDDMREFHPYWKNHARHDPTAAQATQNDAGLWYLRLYREAMQSEKNIIFETSMRNPLAVQALAAELKTIGYRVETVVLAVDREKSRLATLRRYAEQLANNDIPRFVPGKYHDEAYANLRSSLRAIDQAKAVDQIQIVTHAGSVVYVNELVDGQWKNAPRAGDALDAERESSATPKRLAENALRWHTLVARLQAHAETVPHQVIDQAITWRRQASDKALENPAARKIYQLGLTAEAFKTLTPEQFQHDFPTYAAASDKLRKAQKYAAEQLDRPAAREQFLSQVRENIANQIREGRQFTRSRTMDASLSR